MKTLLHLTAFVFLGLASLSAAENAAYVAVRRADTARIQATIAGDAARLSSLLSDDLTYGNADGRVQTKAELITAVATNRVRYDAYDYLDAKLRELASGAVAMSGRAQVRAHAGEKVVEMTLRFLAVWRQEDDGRWRLAAYQSVQLADTPPVATPTK
jgi:ketosteroid isomerase-like protein